jgi:ribonucleases P/MRP protein subunit RPP40
LSNLLICHESIIDMLDKGSSVDVIYLDLQKAFDKVPHDILMHKIRNIGIIGKIGDWIEEWLNNRKQRVVINGSKSEWSKVSSGVPQGSILGPLLFNVFINDLENDLVHKVLKFADDSKLWGKVDNFEERESMQNDLDKLGVWAQENRMPFNVSKCKVMHIGKKNVSKMYKLMGKDILKSNEEKDLGVYFSSEFKPTLNCNKVSKSANSIMGLIRRNIINKSPDGMIILYKTLVRPKIDYCIQVWRPFLKKDIQILERIQKKFTKMIKGYKDKSYAQRLNKLGITSLEDRHYRADMIQVFKILNNNKDIYPTDFLVSNNRLGRGHSLKLFKKRCNLEIRRHSFTFRVVDRWNRLPEEVILSRDVNDFKGKLDFHMRCTRGHF